MHSPNQMSALVIAAFLLTTSVAIAADGGDWIVSRSSGEIWLSGSEAQQASLKQDDLLKPGDTIRTGRTGRVLLKRGEESILIAPNSVVGIPAEKKEGRSTTIVQQAGSILLDVEKRNVKHFEVETPYLAAVVKGTQFRVTVNAGKTSVDVVRGQVEVADFKSGQIARVMAGQHATAFAHGKNGLSLGGTGTLNPIEQGKPRAPSIERVPVPRGGLSIPRNAANGQNAQPLRQTTVQTRGGVTRISSAIGETRLNVQRATHGFARDKSATHGGGRNGTNKDTIWNSSGVATGSPVANSSRGNGNAVTGASSVSSTIAAVSGADGGASGKSNNGKGKGDGNGQGNGNGNGHGNGNGNGNGKGNGNANGNGNGGNGANGNGRGNGHANGHGKK